MWSADPDCTLDHAVYLVQGDHEKSVNDGTTFKLKLLTVKQVLSATFAMKVLIMKRKLQNTYNTNYEIVMNDYLNRSDDTDTYEGFDVLGNLFLELVPWDCTATSL